MSSRSFSIRPVLCTGSGRRSGRAFAGPCRRRRPARRSPVSRAWYFFALFVVTTALTACNSIGCDDVHVRQRIDFGPSDVLSLCLLLDDGIADTMAVAIINDAWRDEYGLGINVGSVCGW